MKEVNRNNELPTCRRLALSSLPTLSDRMTNLRWHVVFKRSYGAGTHDSVFVDKCGCELHGKVGSEESTDLSLCRQKTEGLTMRKGDNIKSFCLCMPESQKWSQDKACAWKWEDYHGNSIGSNHEPITLQFHMLIAHGLPSNMLLIFQEDLRDNGP